MCQFIIYSCIDSDINSKYSESFLFIQLALYYRDKKEKMRSDFAPL